ncbi:hypothetical protein AGMMS49957_03080 [Synergistales bacterium]|nr:hypothetical protein AGMMS49957_03080 [Synergistales bacterium]
MNKKTRKTTTFRVAFVLVTLLSFLTLSPSAKAAVKAKQISVVVATFPPYDFVRSITDDRVELSMLLSPGAEPHSFDPSPRDIIKMRDCDLFIYVGGESDVWVRQILDSLATNVKRPKVLHLMDYVDAVKEKSTHALADDEEESDYDGHIWTSPANAKKIVTAISEALCAIDKKNAKFYQKNTADEIAKIDKLDALFRAIVDGGARKTMIFADRFPFRYFADYYGLDCRAAFPDCSSETEASVGTVAFLIKKTREEKIPAVFFVEFSNEKMADILVSETGAKKLLFHSAHNVSKDDFESGVTYISIMERNAKNLKEALN